MSISRKRSIDSPGREIFQLDIWRTSISRETIEAIRLGKPVDALDPTDALIVTLGREAFELRKVSSETYRRALETFGTRRLVDLVSLMGNYASTAVMLTVFDMQLDKGVDPPLPEL